MSAAALSPDHAKSGALNVAAVREDLARTYNPSGALELMLVTQMSQTWVRLQTAYDVDRRYREGRDMLEVITSKPSEFKAIQSYVRDCERAWNHAKQDLEKAQRKRQREAAAAPSATRQQPRSTPSATAAPIVSASCPTSVMSPAPSRRE